MEHSPGQPTVSRAHPESGVALVTVLILLGSMALLMAGVYQLVSEGTRSANEGISYRVSFSSAVSGGDRLDSLIDQATIPGFSPPAPPGYGVVVSSTSGDGQWNSRQAFADFLRNQLSRAGGDGPSPCTQNDPDIRYTVPAPSGQVTVVMCVRRSGASALPGSGSGVIFANASGNTADEQIGFEVDVWASGSRQALAQVQGVARGIH